MNATGAKASRMLSPAAVVGMGREAAERPSTGPETYAQWVTQQTRGGVVTGVTRGRRGEAGRPDGFKIWKTPVSLAEPPPRAAAPGSPGFFRSEQPTRGRVAKAL
jgi:hypothetical protein